MHVYVRSIALVAFALFLSLPAVAQPSAEASSGPLETPRAFLGYALGERFTPPHRVVAYARHVANASPRAQLEQYGTTYEGRPLVLLTLSAPENLARREAIRQDHLRRIGLGTAGTTGAAGNSENGDENSDEKAVIWLSYNVHGDEAVGSEAALKTLHALADPQNARTGRWLQDAVVLLDPCLNPDGRARYVQWYRQTRGARPNARPEAREHHQDWPGGRPNHYLFDLNRDWAWATQRETRARLEQYHRWMPHVHVDFHEQGVDDPYYFAPGSEPMHEALTPFQRRFQRTMGQANAEVFDRAGWLYFTEEVFDLFYPGYGDTWPLFNGAIGMTYEQAGGGRAGLLIQTATDSLSLGERIAHHHAAALSTVETAVAEHVRLARAFADYYRSAREDPPGETAAYVVSGENEDRRRALARLLDRQRIRYGYAAGAARARGTRYATGETERFQIAAGDLIVPAAQSKGRLVKVLFERRPALGDSLTYDITAWGLPFAYNMEAYALDDRPEVATRSTALPIASEATQDEAAAPYAYLGEWESLADARLLGRLLEKGVHVRFAQQPFEANGRRWERGTLVIARADNGHLGTRFADTIRAAARRFDQQGRQPLVPLQSGLTGGGPDVGSAAIALVEEPAVAVLAGSGLSPSSVGEVWHFFDQRLHYPATLLQAADVSADLLESFDVLVMPSGDYEEVFPEDERASLRQWVEDGGRLIALGEATDFLAEAEAFGLERRDAAEEDSEDSADDGTTEEAGVLGPHYDQRERTAASERVPGAIFRAVLDPTHPLAYGYARENPSKAYYYTLKRGPEAFAPLSEGWTVAALPAGEKAAPVSGFAGAEAQRQLAGTLVFGVEEKGQGRVVYLADDPLFRGFWQGGMLLFANAVFLVGQE